MTGIKEIYISAENRAEGEWNYEDDNVDVLVTFNNGKIYMATFFTYANIEHLRRKNNNTGECLSGKYFWASDMVLIDNCSRQSIEEVIKYLLDEDEFYDIFNEIESE